MTSQCRYQRLLLTTALFVFAVVVGRSCADSDAVFMIDITGGGSETNFIAARLFLWEEISQLLAVPGNRVGVVTFASAASVEFRLGSPAPTREQFYGAIKFNGNSSSSSVVDYNAPLRLAYQQLFGRTARKKHSSLSACNVAPFITSSNDVSMQAVYMARLIRNVGIKLIAVGIGPDAQLENLMSVTADQLSVHIIKNAEVLLGPRSLPRDQFVTVVANDINAACTSTG